MRHFSGEFGGMRLLMLDELDRISGGEGEDTDSGPAPEPIQDIIVTAQMDGGNTWFIPFQEWHFGGLGGTATYNNPEDYDQQSIHIDTTITRALTPAETAAVGHLATAIQNITNVINSLSDTASITLPNNGGTVTGLELKEMWSKTDFTINEAGTSYSNTTTRGAADWNGGNPHVSFNIDTVTAYDSIPGGMNHMALHELGHMTVAGRASNAAVWADNVVTPTENTSNEQIANDIARAIAASSGLPTVANPFTPYGTPNPLVFQ